jgi:hypothetical protein
MKTESSRQKAVGRKKNWPSSWLLPSAYCLLPSRAGTVQSDTGQFAALQLTSLSAARAYRIAESFEWSGHRSEIERTIAVGSALEK